MFIRWLATAFEAGFRGSSGPGRHAPAHPKAGSVAALNSARTGRSPAEARTVAGDFRAVSVAPAATCCRAAEEQHGHRYLISEQPRLPLERCSMPGHCRCRYEMHVDRRKGERRSPGVVWPRMKLEGLDRRRSSGRRRGDRPS